MDDLKEVRISVSIHTVAGMIMGWLSFILNDSKALILGFVFLFVIGFLTERVLGKRGFKWWLSNGIVIYILVWIVAWIFLLNTIV